MKPLIFLVTAAALLGTAPAAAKKTKLPPYGNALRCAALTGASMRQAMPLSDDGVQRFDYALFWGLAAADSARQAKIAAPVFEADLEKALAGARVELDGRDAPAAAELAQCVRQVPPLKRKKGAKRGKG